MSDLFEIIEDSLTDAIIPDNPDPIEATPDDAPVEPQDAPETTPDTDVTLEPTLDPGPAPTTTDKASPTPPKPDDFGIPSHSASGRENRLPYSRVTKIVDKAKKDTETRIKSEVEASYTPKITEYETKIKDYEGKLENVAQFEHVMMNDSKQFITMLRNIPAYNDIFKALDTPSTPTTPAVEAPVPDDMPQPDQELSDGSFVYSMEGLKTLLKWQANQVKEQVTKEVTSRYAPIEDEWQAHRKVQELMPKVQQQITDARTWPLFNENEADIVKALQDNRALTLEGAYQKVVWPKMIAERDRLQGEAKVNRDTVRAEILKELKQAPRATSASAQASRSAAPASTGPRSLEDVIKEAVQDHK